MKDDTSRWTNLADEVCQECQAAPGEEHAQGCETGGRNMPSDDAHTKRELGKAAKAYADHLKHLEALRSLEKALVLKGFPKDAIRRALKEASMPGNVRAKHDQAWLIARSAFGAPVQMELDT